MLLYRITHKDFSTKLYGSGAPGRWNGEGKKVIYSAESIPLAFLENMIRRQGVGFNQDFKIMIIDIPDNLKLTAINVADLETGWRDFKNYSKCQPLGDKWYDESKTLALKVPSAILPVAFNYVINTTHPDFKKIQLIGTTDLVPDQRIEELLKQYSGK
jgi:RES domain-containing protein